MSEDAAGLDLPTGWFASELGKVAKWGSGGTPKAKNPAFYDGDIPWAVIGDLNDGLVTATATSITRAGLEASSAKLIPPGTLLIAMYGSIGKLGIAGVELATNQAIAFATPDERIVTSRFLFNYLAYQKEKFLSSGKGMTQQNISQTILKSWPIPCPPLEEQKRIVEILEEQLSRLDAALTSVRAAREKAARFRRSFIESCIYGHLSASFSNTWELKSLDDLVEHKSDIVDGPFGSNLKSEHYVSAGARVIRLQNIGYGDFRDDEAFISLEHFDRLRKHSAEVGDLLFASLGENLPRTCLVPSLDTPAIVKADCIRVRLSESVDSRFVLLATQTQLARTWAAEQLHGMGRPRLGLGNIRKFPVRLPPLEIQRQIVEFVDAQLEGMSWFELRCLEFFQNTNRFRRSLLHAAFTGELTKEWREGAHV